MINKKKIYKKIDLHTPNKDKIDFPRGSGILSHLGTYPNKKRNQTLSTTQIK